MIKKPIRYLTLSDIHLGHARNKTFDIIKALNVFFDDYKARTDLDIIFLAGDVFDQLLDFSMTDIPEITFWVDRLVDYCSRNKIKLRVLEGTPSHDWGQSEIFNTIDKVVSNEVDMKYVKTLSIEHMSDLGLNVLYVPDEWNASTDKTLEEVKDLLAQNNLAQVDIAVMHGNFGYQLPVQAIKAPRHNEQEYLSLVKYFITIGHIHSHSVYERIIAQGSFDRLAHGEEEPKGGVECVIYPDGRGEYFFIENKLAKIFKTVTLKSKDIDSSISQIEKQTRNFKTDSYVRIRASKDHPAIIGFDELRKRFPMFVLTKITTEEEAETSHKLIDDITEDLGYTPITITKENVRDLLFSSLSENHTFTSRQVEIFDSIMSEVR